jgi:hypothetical protein
VRDPNSSSRQKTSGAAIATSALSASPKLKPSETAAHERALVTHREGHSARSQRVSHKLGTVNADAEHALARRPGATASLNLCRANLEVDITQSYHYSAPRTSFSYRRVLLRRGIIEHTTVTHRDNIRA